MFVVVLYKIVPRRGVAVAFFPKSRIEAVKQGADRVIPAPEQIVRQFTQARNRRGKRRTDQELLDRLNLEGHVDCKRT